MKLRQGMTVADLITALKDMDRKLPVFFAYDYGDHWHTTVAAKVDAVDEQQVTYSAYHNMGKVVDESSSSEPDPSETINAVVIS